jgi:hypothetical protein
MENYEDDSFEANEQYFEEESNLIPKRYSDETHALKRKE